MRTKVFAADVLERMDESKTSIELVREKKMEGREGGPEVATSEKGYQATSP